MRERAEVNRPDQRKITTVDEINLINGLWVGWLVLWAVVAIIFPEAERTKIATEFPRKPS